MAIQLLAKTPDKTEQEWSWPPPQGEWTYDDYACLPNNGMRYEVIEGDLYMSPAPRPKHQEIIIKLIYLFYQFVNQHNLGKVYHAPIDVILPGITNPVQPDLLFISSDRLDIVKEKKIEGVPDLVVEVLSPDNPMLDRDTKFHAYARAGVCEYWIVDPDAGTVDVFVLRGHAYARLGKYGKDEEAHSELLTNFSAHVKDICTL